jgi:signal transduction histidine kinase
VAEGAGRLYTVMLRDISERVRVEEALHASREELRRLSGGIQAAREQEKARLARELHDDLGQQLTALKLDVTILEDELHAKLDHGALLSHVHGMFSLLDATVSAVRRIAADLRPAILDDLGLEPSIEWLVEDFSDRYGIVVHTEVDTRALEFTPDAATAIFRIVQEGLTNVARHAQASSVSLTLRLEARGFVVQLVDDGVGCVERAAGPRDSFGLLGVRERAHLLGGTLTIDSAPGAGFRLTVVLPPHELRAHRAQGPS